MQRPDSSQADALRAVYRLRSGLHTRGRRLLAVWAMLALGFAALAHAGHLHRPDGTAGDAHQEICGLCLHFERVGAPPAALMLPAVLLVAIAWLSLAAGSSPIQPAPQGYHARAPPAF